MVEKIIQIAEESGKIILSHYLKKNNYEIKKDGSPLTVADSESHNHIFNELRSNFDFPIFIYFHSYSKDVYSLLR